ncbi:MAG: hypothetical protein WCS37_21080, partial [Chloroflexota bacterium]
QTCRNGQSIDGAISYKTCSINWRSNILQDWPVMVNQLTEQYPTRPAVMVNQLTEQYPTRPAQSIDGAISYQTCSIN